MRLRIMYSCSFFFLYVSVENIENSTSTSCHNFCMDDVITMEFFQNVQNKILFTYHISLLS